MLPTPPPLRRQPGFIQQFVENDILEINGLDELNGINEQLQLENNENLGELQTLDLNETVYRGINISRKASSYSNLEELSRFNNKSPLIKKFNSF